MRLPKSLSDQPKISHTHARNSKNVLSLLANGRKSFPELFSNQKKFESSFLKDSAVHRIRQLATVSKTAAAAVEGKL